MIETYTGIIILDNDATIPLTTKAETEIEAKEKINVFWSKIERGRNIKDIIVANAKHGVYIAE